jgi:NAD(P)-dependent dehydrogenase (short-subunit alcohol dehydrogenase family)
MNRFSDKTVLVTGASRGIGAALAERLAAEGAKVAITARTLAEADSPIEGSLEATVERIRGRGGVAAPFVADLAVPGAGRHDLVNAIADQMGTIDILINNAAANFYQPVEQISDKRFRIAMEVNLHAPLELAQAVIPGMRAKGAGSILNISSATAQAPRHHPSKGTSGPLLYVATKAALERATSALAEELFIDGISVNSLAPQAGVRTAAAEQYYALPEESVEPVETMAEAALALCCGDPAVVTGIVTRSLEYLVANGTPVYSLDALALLKGWQPTDIPPSRLSHHIDATDESSLRV